jgi:mRNA interferase HigB
MVIISYAALRSFYQKHPDAEDALNNWYRVTEDANWSNFHEVKNVFNTVDAVGNDRYVFNIRGNKYRLVAVIKFKSRTVYIRFVGTHAAYDKTDASTI